MDAVPLEALCLRLNDVEWAAEQLLALAARLRADVRGLGGLPGDAVRQCELSCRDLLDYITARIVFYELEPLLVGHLYAPTAAACRLGPLLERLEPLLAEVRSLVAPRWAQRLPLL